MKWLVTGAAGFIGTALVRYLTERGHEVAASDNFHRTRPNDCDLPASFLDVRFAAEVDAWFARHRDADVIAHLAGQVSMVSSIADPRYDFETNALGTFNVLEAMRRHTPDARLIFAGTNKVYGDLAGLRCEEHRTRFVLPDYPAGLPENLPIALHGGYSCSKGAADHYVRDYAAMHGLKTVVLRQSSVYGGGQYSTEDQGWAAWFVRMGTLGRRFSICGTGKQVRDLLHVTDLCRCYEVLAGRDDDSPVWGSAFNAGGGPENSLSLVELFARLREDHGLRVEYTTGPPRPADQNVFIADISGLRDLTGWAPQNGLNAGLAELVEWSRSRADGWRRMEPGSVGPRRLAAVA